MEQQVAENVLDWQTVAAIGTIVVFIFGAISWFIGIKISSKLNTWGNEIDTKITAIGTDVTSKITEMESGLRIWAQALLKEEYVHQKDLDLVKHDLQSVKEDAFRRIEKLEERTK